MQTSPKRDRQLCRPLLRRLRLRRLRLLRLGLERLGQALGEDRPEAQVLRERLLLGRLLLELRPLVSAEAAAAPQRLRHRACWGRSSWWRTSSAHRCVNQFSIS